MKNSILDRALICIIRGDQWNFQLSTCLCPCFRQGREAQAGGAAVLNRPQAAEGEIE